MALTRLLTLTAPQGDDVLIPIRLSVSERISEPYRIDVEVLSDNHTLQGADLLTESITVTVHQMLDDAPVVRYFHGDVVQFERLGPGDGGKSLYRLVAAPSLWRLGLRANCRIFQELSVQDIVGKVLGDHNLPAPVWGILPTLEPLPYCTQFNETDLAFVSRLLEEHGIGYYFVHQQGSHTLHCCATANGFPPFEGGDITVLHHSDDLDKFSRWTHVQQARSASVYLEDMDGERSQPSVVLEKKSKTQKYEFEPQMWSPGEIFRWPGGMATRPGVDCADVAMGGEETASDDYEASAIDPRLTAGVRVTVPVKTENGKSTKSQYLVTGVHHQASDESQLRTGAGTPDEYGCSLVLVAAARKFMPPARHSRPVLSGVYSAKVTGPSGEKIHVDEDGRIKILFRWDRTGPKDDASSCWVRVAQSAAGAWGGTWFLPRVGDEVLVSFLDGDPDRPIVMGSVYGKDSKPPFNPSANPAQSGIRTRSHPSDSADDANILRIEDKKGNEEILLHAQKDLKVEVENDETRSIKHSRTVTIDEADDKLTVSQGNRTATVSQGNDTLTVTQGNREIKLSQGNETRTLSMGDLSIKCELGNITLEAMQKITLKVGQNTIEISQAGITAKGLIISSEAQAQNTVKAPMVQINGEGMVQVQGGLVMIN